MSFLKNIFGSTEEENPKSNIKWDLLTQLNQLDEMVEVSATLPVLVFKHSTRCSISRMALKQFEREFDLQGKVVPYFLDLLTYRPISNEIASRFNVVHQSPQLIVIKNGEAVYDASHSEIQVEDLKQFL